jgi:hypothetical protein
MPAGFGLLLSERRDGTCRHLSLFDSISQPVVRVRQGQQLSPDIGELCSFRQDAKLGCARPQHH